MKGGEALLIHSNNMLARWAAAAKRERDNVGRKPKSGWEVTGISWRIVFVRGGACH
jgi:hypothetical protein